MCNLPLCLRSYSSQIANRSNIVDSGDETFHIHPVWALKANCEALWSVSGEPQPASSNICRATITTLQPRPALLPQPVAAFCITRVLLLLAFDITAPGRACLHLLYCFWWARVFRWWHLHPRNADMTWSVLLLLKQAEQAQVKKTPLCLNCFRNPTSTCATGSWRKHNSVKKPTDWMLP